MPSGPLGQLLARLPAPDKRPRSGCGIWHIPGQRGRRGSAIPSGGPYGSRPPPPAPSGTPAGKRVRTPRALGPLDPHLPGIRPQVLAIVFRRWPVRRSISRIRMQSVRLNRRIPLNNSVSITPTTPTTPPRRGTGTGQLPPKTLPFPRSAPSADQQPEALARP